VAALWLNPWVSCLPQPALAIVSLSAGYTTNNDKPQKPTRHIETQRGMSVAVARCWLRESHRWGRHTPITASNLGYFLPAQQRSLRPDMIL
jgi:hypothetical protein